MHVLMCERLLVIEKTIYRTGSHTTRSIVSMSIQVMDGTVVRAHLKTVMLFMQHSLIIVIQYTVSSAKELNIRVQG